jgi:hypothetical protein
VQVAVRVRPPNHNDIDSDVVTTRDESDAKIVLVNDGKRGRNFGFDNVFDGAQESVYNAIGKPMLDEAYKGFNVCLFAYGQTGSGKTYSIQGDGTADGDGVIPRFIRDLFHTAQSKVEDDGELTVKITMTFLEVYMERVRDLLAPRTRGVEPENLEILESTARNKKVFVKGLGVHPVLGPERVTELLARGNANRQTAETKMNEVSSRSHSIVQFTISQLHESVDRRDIESVVSLVDLAGSERQGKTESTGLQFEEAKKINQSLLALGRALNSFSEGRGDMVSLRDSKLTRLLSESFGGNNKTWMLATVAPTAYNASETLSTLEYATHAKKITNRATVNNVARRLEVAQLRERESKLHELLAAVRVASAAKDDERRTLMQLRDELNVLVADKFNVDCEARYLTAVQENDKLRSQLSELWKQRASAAAVASSALDDDAVPCFSSKCTSSLSHLMGNRFEYLTLAMPVEEGQRYPPTLTVHAYLAERPDVEGVSKEESAIAIDISIVKVCNLPSRCCRGARVRYSFNRIAGETMVTELAPNPDPRFDFSKRFVFAVEAGELERYLQGPVLSLEVIGYC